MVNESLQTPEDEKEEVVNIDETDAGEVKSDDVFHKKEMEEATQKTEGEVFSLLCSLLLCFTKIFRFDGKKGQHSARADRKSEE